MLGETLVGKYELPPRHRMGLDEWMNRRAKPLMRLHHPGAIMLADTEVVAKNKLVRVNLKLRSFG